MCATTTIPYNIANKGGRIWLGNGGKDSEHAALTSSSSSRNIINTWELGVILFGIESVKKLAKKGGKNLTLPTLLHHHQESSKSGSVAVGGIRG
eukprot:scaffold8605_cov178-Amphora_coffeaeformis.AAC.7